VALRFWDLTPSEFAIHQECWRRTCAREDDRMAKMLSMLKPAVWRKRRMKPQDFLGRPLVDEQKRRRKKTED